MSDGADDTVRRPVVFYAIPCGAFYSVQSNIIRDVTRKVEADALIEERDIATTAIWENITQKIRECDLFVADISSRSHNVILELGYALREKSLRDIAVFESDAVTPMTDLGMIKHRKYSSFINFQTELAAWLANVLPRRAVAMLNTPTQCTFSEDFMSIDSLTKWWWLPPMRYIAFTGEGLKVSGLDRFPLLTAHLALLRNYEFEFHAKITAMRIGWVVMGTRPMNAAVPLNWVMFNIDLEGRLRPHVGWCRPETGEFGYNDEQGLDIPTIPTSFRPGKDGWFSLCTRVRGDTAEILHESSVLHRLNIREQPSSKYWRPALQPTGEVGFRCAWGEEAVIRRAVVRELPSI